jgi:hypothetical protein
MLVKKLNIEDRLLLVKILPVKGSFETHKLLEAIKDKLYPSEKEIELYSVKQAENSITWGPKGFEEVEIKFTKIQLEKIVECLDDLSNRNELTEKQYQLFKKFKK